MQKKKITRIYIEGDSCSGKSTFLDLLKDKRFKIIREKGLSIIPEKLEDDKFLSIIWFSLYYYNREITLKTKKIPIIERSIFNEYSLLNFYAKIKKITQKERLIGLKLLDRLVKKMPLGKNDLVIHLVLSNEIIRERVAKRGRNPDKYKDAHWNFLRSETEKYFQKRCIYEKIDTTNLSKKQVKEKIMEIINKYVTKFWRRS